MATTEFNYKAMGDAIKEKRGKHSQTWVCQEILKQFKWVVSVTTISRVESGYECSIQTALVITQWLGRKMDDFVVQFHGAGFTEMNDGNT